MIEIARIFTFGTHNRRDIVRRLMDCSDFFKGLPFGIVMQQFRYAEVNGLVHYGDGFLVVYHDCD